MYRYAMLDPVPWRAPLGRYERPVHPRRMVDPDDIPRNRRDPILLTYAVNLQKTISKTINLSHVNELLLKLHSSRQDFDQLKHTFKFGKI